MATGIPVQAWLAEDPRVIATAIEVLKEQAEAANRRG